MSRIVLYDTKTIEREYKKELKVKDVAKKKHLLINNKNQIEVINPEGESHSPSNGIDNVYLHRGHGGYEFMTHSPVVGLKLLVEEDEKYYSIYNPDFEYKRGYTYSQRVLKDHGGGMYLYATSNIDHFMYAVENNAIFINHPARGYNYGVARCTATGPFIAYDRDGWMLSNSIADLQRTKKLACSSLAFDSVVYRF